MSITTRNFFFLLAAFGVTVFALVTVQGQPAFAATDLALNRAATASSSESSQLAPTYANDGNSATRWSSTTSANPQSWRVDLGVAQHVDQIWINWEAAYASNYALQLSTDGTNYTTVWSGGASGPGWKAHDFAPRQARYVRFYGRDRATQWGFSFWDLVVYNTGGSVGGGPATLRPVGSPPLSDAEAASRVKRDPWEPRPQNTWYNHNTPTQAQLEFFRSRNAWSSSSDSTCEWMRHEITGNFTGTTDEIIQWAAHKWGFPEDELRAIAVAESWWRQPAGGWDGGGLMSVTQAALGIQHLDPQNGIHRTSTAFNVDFFAAFMRYYFEGCATWLNTVERGWNYGAGDMWGSFGAWYSGRWHTDASEWYIDKVQRELWAKTWEGF
ncbi:MAG TPA: discoidin domain-containing protein [Chloroflexota bacterium]|nr:discoidin domain-containing protein [Chloroflexota bacterium]